MERHTKPIRLREAIHILPADVHIPGARKTVRLREELTWGPCSASPEVHRSLRMNWIKTIVAGARARGHVAASRTGHAGRSINTASQLQEALEAYPSSYPVVIWTSGDSADRLLYWWTLSALKSIGSALSRFWLAESIFPTHNDASLATQPTGSVTHAFASIEQLSQARLRSGASLWNKFTRTSPRELDSVRLRGRARAHDIRAIENLYYWGVPTAFDDAERPLGLSELDRLLLSHLNTNSWVRPLDIIVSARENQGVRAAVHIYGDNALALRLDDWAAGERQEPAIRSQSVPGVRNNISGVAFQLTDRGHELLAKGIDDPATAPQFYIGGFKAYDRGNLWARRIDTLEGGWRLERLQLKGRRSHENGE